MRDARGVAGVFADVRPQLVFHLAAQIDVRRSVADPAADADVNVLGAINVLAAAREHGARRVVNTSTGGGLYGDAELLPTPEDPPISPLAPYGQSKLAAEGYFELYARLFGLSTVSLRYGNVYGRRQDVHGEAGVVAIFCGCLLEGRAPQVFGDGRQTRDWVDAADVVRANLLAAAERDHRPDQHRPRPGDVGARSARRASRRRRRARALSLPDPIPAGAPRRGRPQLPRRQAGSRGAGLGARGEPARRAGTASWRDCSRFPARGDRRCTLAGREADQASRSRR